MGASVEGSAREETGSDFGAPERGHLGNGYVSGWEFGGLGPDMALSRCPQQHPQSQ